MEGVLRVLERIENVLDRQAQGRDNVASAAVDENQANAGQAQPAGVKQMPRLVEQFMKLKPPKFHGRRTRGTAPTWAMFVENFYEKYFSENAQEKKMEFMRLRQGQMTVDQYEAEFARLAKFAPTMVENPRDRARRFRDGLKPDLRSLIWSHDNKDYEEMHRRAQIMERGSVGKGSSFRIAVCSK
ncbi:hypothetical protein NL676_003944 [Syzygium grande]|nr:hypothetical protein NL676_003944 [Syzygium grande]